MTVVEALWLTKRILRARHDLSETVKRCSPENDLVGGSALNLTSLAGDIAVLRAWIERNPTYSFYYLVDKIGESLD